MSELSSLALDSALDTTQVLDQPDSPVRRTAIEARPFVLETTQALHIVVIFEEFVDQLDLMATVIQAPHVEIRSKASINHELANNRTFIKSASNENVSCDEDKYYRLKHHYGSSIPRKLLFAFRPPPRREIPLSSLDILQGERIHSDEMKLQHDRGFLQLLISNSMNYLLKNNSFEYLASAVREQLNNKNYMLEMFKKIIDDTETIKLLKKDQIRIKKLHTKEGALLDAQIHQVRDQLLEMSCRKPMEATFTQKFGAVMVSRVRKRCTKNEKEVTDKLRETKMAAFTEIKCHQSMMRIIGNQLEKAKKILSYWMGKYDRDTTRLQVELDELKNDRAKMLARIAYLREMIPNYREIVKDDRRVKKIAHDRLMKRNRDNKWATKIQAWWRGNMVRNSLGPFKNLYSELVAHRLSRQLAKEAARKRRF